MTDGPQFTGADLARMALANARKAAPNNPVTGPSRPKRTRVRRTGEGRDPVSLAAAIADLGSDLPFEAGVAGGSVINDWSDLCPQYVGCIEPVGYDKQSGRLDLRPSTHAYAAQLRLLGGQLAKQINDKMGRPIVRTIRVLPVGNLTTSTRAAASAGRAEPQGPVKTRETASAGYRATFEAAMAHRRPHQPTDPYTLEAMARQEAAARANRLPDDEHTEGQWAQDDAERKAGPRSGSLEASIAAAIAYKRRAAAGLAEPRRAFDVA